MIPTDFMVGAEDEKSLISIDRIDRENTKVLNRIDNIRRSEYKNSISKITNTETDPADSLIAIFVEFSDIKHRTSPSAYTTAQFEDMLFATNNYTHPDGHATYGSLRKYYYDMSNGSYDLKGRVGKSIGAIPVWVTLNDTKLNYHNGTVSDFLNDVFVAAENAGYDTTRNSDRVIVIIYAGNLYQDSKTLNPRAVGYSYIMSERCGTVGGVDNNNEPFSHIGIHAHELGHVIGDFDDYYKSAITDYSVWGLMARGDLAQVNNPGDCPATLEPQLRSQMGWLSPTTISTCTQNQQISCNTDVYKLPARLNNQTYLIDTEEYFLIENRQTGSGWNAGLPEDDGVLIWHVKTNPSCFPRPTMDLIEADGSNGTSVANLNLDAFRYGNVDKISDFTLPANLKKFDPYNSSVKIENISASASTMTADISPYYSGTLA